MRQYGQVNCRLTSTLQKSHEVKQPDQATSRKYSAQHIEAIVLDTVPVFNTVDENQNGFQLRIMIDDDGRMYKIECAFDGSQKKKCVVYDDYDSVPIAIAANDQMLFYEPSGGVFLLNHLGWSLSIEPLDDGVQLRLGFDQKEKEAHISIDLRPLVHRAFVDQIVEQIDHNRYRYLARTGAGNRIEAIVDAQKKQYESLSSWIQGEEFIVLKVLTGDRMTSGSSFEFPRIPDHLETKPFSFPDIDKMQLTLQTKGIEELMGLAYRFLNIREAIRQPAKRGEIEEYLGEEFDWIALTNDDNKVSAQLRSLVKQ